jgi:2-amino-4-hydroxy-6-hydroxymethyldihydropteridine diphosphokinase
MERVAVLLKGWARAAGLDPVERRRWVALGRLHDVLKGEDPEKLRADLPPELAALPDPVLHGPAVAERLRSEGVEDEPFLSGLAWHTLGHAGLDRAGRALYAADFLEPGRRLREKWRGKLRARMPDDLDDVLVEILRARMRHLLDRGRPVRPETLAFWNAITATEGKAWAPASEL